MRDVSILVINTFNRQCAVDILHRTPLMFYLMNPKYTHEKQCAMQEKLVEWWKCTPFDEKAAFELPWLLLQILKSLKNSERYTGCIITEFYITSDAKVNLLQSC